MNHFKYIIALLLLTISSVSTSKILSVDEYNNIKDVFFQNAEKDFIGLKIKNYKNISDEEAITLEKITLENKNDEFVALSNAILNGQNLNNYAVIEYEDDKVAWVMPTAFEPKGFLENNCAYWTLIANYNCLSTAGFVKNDLKNFLIKFKLPINEEYFANFIYIHELSHLIKKQKIMPDNIDVTKIWTDDVELHYREVYSDLFAIIFLHNYLKYPENEIDNILLFRNFNLHSKNDLNHYSPPYIHAMLNNNYEWKTLKSFDDIDVLIRSIFKDVNDNSIVSKKEYHNIYDVTFKWCNNLKFGTLKTKNTLDLIISHCKNLKR